MNWNEHYTREGEHAFLSASKYHWLNYTFEKLEDVFRNEEAKKKGIKMHEFACTAINEKVKLAKNKSTISQYVNDCIGFGMRTEQRVEYSPLAFGTADAISFKDGTLRIFDYKSGFIKASFKQLDIYAAYFCLEYNVDPKTIIIEQRIYQNNAYTVQMPEGEYIQAIMDHTVACDAYLQKLMSEF